MRQREPSHPTTTKEGRRGSPRHVSNAIINAARFFNRWAIARELLTENAASSVRLPLIASEERDRIATPGEFAVLLDQLGSRDALPGPSRAMARRDYRRSRYLNGPRSSSGCHGLRPPPGTVAGGVAEIAGTRDAGEWPVTTPVCPRPSWCRVGLAREVPVKRLPRSAISCQAILESGRLPR